jgi:hypothetical protein
LRVSLGTRIVTITVFLPMSIPAARSQNSGSSAASSIALSYHGDAEKVTAARRSQGQSGNLVRGLEAPIHSPQDGSRRSD